MRIHLVDCLVERVLGRRPVRAYDGSVGLHAHDVSRCEGTLVDRRRGDPHVSVFVHDGQIATGGGGHLAAIDPADDDSDLLGGMHEINVKLFHDINDLY